MKQNATILYIEDDSDTRRVYGDFFKQHATTLITAENGAEGLSKFITHHPDLVITDIRMNSGNGPELITAIRKIDEKTPIIVFSAYVKEDFIKESIRTKVNGYIQKPSDNELFSSMINDFLTKKDKNKAETIKKSAYIDEENDLSIHHTKEDGLMIVGIGASAGGLEALSALVAGLPKENNTAYVVAQHLSPTHKTMLVDLLSRETKLFIKDAEHGETLQSDVIYITPPNSNIELNSKNQIILSAPEKYSFLPKPSVNQLFISLAENKKDKSVGIILSGTGSDGAQGMRAINSEGGITIVQEPSSAKYDGMPMASINGCSVDIVIEANLIGEELVALANFPRQKVLKRHQIIEPNDEISTIFRLLYQYKKIDFAVYKNTTIGRRIERRMVAIKVTTLRDYVDVLEKDKKEVELLYKDILIGVTRFFRDKECFNSLKNILNKYLDENEEQSEFRIWMPGSSTGEEAYSISILLQEILEQRNQTMHIRIFATDIDDDALKIARKGIYSEASMSEIDEDMIKKCFNIKNNEFEVKKHLRENIVFSFHNLLADPPFKDLDLVVCRNLLIYFNLDAQKYIMPSFHYGLKNNGILFLGKAENATNFEHFFVPTDKLNKIFKTIPVSKKDYNIATVTAPIYAQANVLKKNKDDFKVPLHDTVISEASKILMPNIIVTNEQLEVIYKKGSLSYVNIPEGYVSYNLYKLVDPKLSIDLRTIVNTAKKEEITVSSAYIPTLVNGTTRLVKIYAVPIINNRTRMFIFYFHEIDEKDMPQFIINTTQGTSSSSDHILELELHRTKEHMQTLVEELETSNEELQSTNEELQSSNEELQSTNEELETSNEELQSTNEELQTAYSELKEMYQNVSLMKDEYSSLTRRYESILNNINDAVIISNLEGVFLRTNTAMERITGYNKDRLLGMCWQDLLNDKETSLYKGKHTELISDGKSGPYVVDISTINKDRKFLSIENYISKDEKGNVQVWSFASDISKEKAIQEKLEMNQKKYILTFEKANIGIAHVGLNGILMSVNNTLCEHLAYTKKELQKLTIKDITYPDDFENDLEFVNKLLAGEEDTYKIEKRYYTKNKTIIWVRISVTIVRNNNNNPYYFILIIENIDKQKESMRQYSQAQVVFNSTQEAIVITDDKTKILSVNPSFEEISGFSIDEIIGKRINVLKSNKHTPEFYADMWRSIKQTGIWSGEIINRNKSGEIYPAYLNINTVKDDNNKVIQYIGVLTDISFIKQSQEKIQFLANHDTLTKLPNRSLLTDRLNHSLEQARRTNSFLALLFIDLDRFKIVNDGLGHQIGDEVLIEVSKRLQTTLRDQDTIARHGGDEFVVIINNLESPIKASKIAQNIIDSISKPMIIESNTIQISSSIGISIYPNDGITSAELIRQADIAMYEAKSAGRNTYRFTSEELSSNAFEKATLENAIRQGLNQHQFEVHYQPIINMKTLEFLHCEALLRWKHPQLGMVMPSKFIPIAEESELIVALDEYVTYEVISNLSKLEKDSICKCKVAINYSIRDFENNTSFHNFKKYLKNNKVDPNSIIIEVTERKFMMDRKDNKQLLNRYKDLGVNFALDDFGTGYSNLGYLSEMPFNTLKIDRSFVEKIGKDKKSEEIIKASIAIAKALELHTIAEGIETKEQFDFLNSYGCEAAQGFYISKAKPMNVILEYINGEKKFLEDENL